MSKSKMFQIVSVFALALLALGCSKTAIEPGASFEEPNLIDEFGGYQPIDDSPGFGDEVLLSAALESEEEYKDPMLVSSGVDSIMNNVAGGRYHLRIIWGQLRSDSILSIPTDWNGSLTISRGVEILRRVVQFERPGDYILPRTSRRLIEWVSHTSTRYDGIAVDIFVPLVRPKIDTTEIKTTDSLGIIHIEIVFDTTWPNIEPVTIEFKTAPYSRTFKLEELASLDTIVYLDDSNAVAFHAFKLDSTVCPRGFMAGGWKFTGENQGVFRGVWMDKFGRAHGYLKGHFGKNPDGLLIFFGKWISREGRFEGFVRGHWEFLNCVAVYPNNCNLAGFFRGRIFNANRETIGALAGQFRGNEITSSETSGFFQGRWKLFCPDELNTDRNAGEGFE